MGYGFLIRSQNLVYLVVLGFVFACVFLLLQLELSVPIGPMYWDTYTYYDAANRILGGQIPSVDFFVPAGPLGYWVATWWIEFFPKGQPVLLLHWSTLTMTVPLMALVLTRLPKKPPLLGLWLLAPFLLFSLLPFNGKAYFPFPGSDGFAYYNRQSCLLLFVLVSGIMFMRDGMQKAGFIAVGMALLFLVKVTGFLAAGIICIFALFTGRVRLWDTIVAALGFCAILAALQAWTGMVSAYISDIALLFTLNSGGLFARLFQSLSVNFGVVAALGALALFLFFADRARLVSQWAVITQDKSRAAVARFLDHGPFWLIVTTLAGVFFETQNTGSQAMIFVWPVLVWIVFQLQDRRISGRCFQAVLVLCCAVYVPLVVSIVERSARTYIGGAVNVAIEHTHLRSLGAVNARPAVVERAATMTAFYAANKEVFDGLAETGEAPSSLPYSEFDFQFGYLQRADAAIDAILTLESESGVRFDTLMALNFTNPFAWLLDRQAPRHLTVGADPFRAVIKPDDETLRAVRAVDLALLPTCPLTSANKSLLELYGAALSRHHRLVLTECYDAFVHPDIGKVTVQNVSTGSRTKMAQ